MTGMNPVTLRGEGSDPKTYEPTGPAAVSVGRVHIKVGDEMKKFVHFVAFEEGEGEGEGDEKYKMLAAVRVDEDRVIQGLKLLFPNGELEEK